MKKDFENKIKEMEDKFNKNLQKVLKDNGELNDKISKLEESKKKLSTENAELKKTLTALQKEKEAKKEEKSAETKPAEAKTEAKPAETKPAEAKVEEKPAEVKPVEAKAEKKEETKVEKKDEGEVKEKKNEEVEKKDIEDSNRIPAYIKDSRGKSMVKYLNTEHPEIRITYDSSNNEGHLYGKKSGNKIVVGTKDFKEVPQILLHEISHVLVNDDVSGVDSLLDVIKKIHKRNGKPLSLVATNNKKYSTPEAKAIEDACELIALYARGDGAFDKYMSELQSGKNGELSKLDRSDVNYLRELCDDIIIGCEDAITDDDEILDKKIKKPMAKTVKMFEPRSAAA